MKLVLLKIPRIKSMEVSTLLTFSIPSHYELMKMSSWYSFSLTHVIRGLEEEILHQ